MKKIIALGIVLLIIAVGYTGAWFWAAGQASDYVKTLETADGESMPRITCGTFGIGGFPFGFDATCTNATIVSRDVTITASGLKASAEVYNPTHVLVFAQSPIAVADAFTGSQGRLDFKDAQASARLSGWRIGRVSVIVDAPVWNDTVLADQLVAKADKLELHLLDNSEKHDAANGLATLAQYIEIDGLVAPGFEIVSGQATLEAEVSNMPDDVRTYGDADLLKRWQAAGGKLQIVGLKADDGPTHFDATGTLGLDSSGRLEGQIKLNSTGVVERMGTSIPEQFKGLLLGGQAADGSYSQTVNIAAGVIFSGLMPAGVVPSLF
ncbi:MAG: DUF2125 domain-containing protein [Devosia sp.]